MRSNTIENALNSLKDYGVKNRMVISKDGELIFSDAKLENPETLFTTGSLVYGSAEKASLEGKKGIPEDIIIESKNEIIVLKGAGKGLILANFQKGLPRENMMAVINNISRKIETLLYIDDIYFTFA